MSEESLYAASEWGARYHSLPHNEALGAGSAGPGKTMVLMAEPLIRVAIEFNRCDDPEYIPPGMTEPKPLEWGGSCGWALFLRRTMPTLQQTMDKAVAMYTRIDPTAPGWNANLHTFTFSSGYKVQFGHCKDLDDWGIYQGNQYDLVLIDELTQFDESQVDQILARIRSPDPVLSQFEKARYMSNPMMDTTGMESVAIHNPHWVRERFVDPFPEGKKTLFRKVKLFDGTEKEWTSIYLPARLTDNPDKAFRERYEFQLQSAKPHIRQAYLFGNWYVTAGSFYADVWNERIHTCESFAIPEDWPVFRSMDWGFKAPGCIHWYAMDPDDTMHVFREYTFKEKTASEVAERVRDIEEDLGLWGKGRSLVTGPADTQLWEARGDVGLSKAEEFAAHGVPWVRADKGPGSRRRNGERVYERLAAHENFTKAPGLIIFRGRCPQLVKCIPQVQTDPEDINCPADSGGDHWMDSLMYGCAYASRPASLRRKKEKDEFEDETPKKASGSRGWGYGR